MVKDSLQVKMAAAWNRRSLIGAELTPCNIIGALSHMTPLQDLLSAADLPNFYFFRPPPRLPNFQFLPLFNLFNLFNPFFGVFCDPRK